MTEEFMDPKHLYFVIAILLGVIVALGTGMGLGKLLGVLAQRVLGKEKVTVNVGATPGSKNELVTLAAHMVDPRFCVDCKAEKERSEDNKFKIAKLDSEFEQFKTKFFLKLENIESGIGDLKVSMAELGVESKYQQGPLGKR